MDTHQVHFFHHYTVITFNDFAPFENVEDIILSTALKRPKIQIYVEVEDTNTEIIYLFRKYQFAYGDKFLHVHRNCRFRNFDRTSECVNNDASNTITESSN